MSATLSDPETLIDFMVTKGNGVKGLSQMNLKTIPHQFIQPQQERLDQTQITFQQSVPVIDLSQPDHSKLICEAAAKFGFFQIINHGIPFQVLENVKQAAHDFFELPVEERIKFLKENSPTHTVQLTSSHCPLADNVLEWKDYLMHFCDGNENEHSKLWPSVSRNQVLEYINRSKPVIRMLLGVLLNGINVKKLNESLESALMGSPVVTLLHYPICPNPDLAAGVNRHSDVSSITLLLQDEVGGLYVRADENDDKWIHVTPVEGALVVNIGDILQIMSNDKYKSAEHRVFLSGSKNRVSVPVFANPLANAVIGPLEEALKDGEKPLYKEIVYSDYFSYFFGKGHDGKRTIDYARM